MEKKFIRGRQLKAMLGLRGVSQRELGKRFKLSDSTVSDWVNYNTFIQNKYVPGIIKTLGMEEESFWKQVSVLDVSNAVWR